MAVFLGSDPGLLKARAFPRVQVSEELLDQAQITLGAHPRAFQGLWDVARASGDAQSWDQSFELVASAKPTRLARLLLARGLSFPQTEEDNKVPHSHPRRQEVSMLLNVPYQGP